MGSRRPRARHRIAAAKYEEPSRSHEGHELLNHKDHKDHKSTRKESAFVFVVPFVVDDTIYVGSADGYLYAIR
jgi:outer membrane protein assembly factor BamB